MAPIKKITKNEVRLQKLPWITNGILISMKSRDKTYKEFIKEKYPFLRNTLHTRYKRMPNLIISLIFILNNTNRMSKRHGKVLGI